MAKSQDSTSRKSPKSDVKEAPPKSQRNDPEAGLQPLDKNKKKTT
jgi:hypothetical protein